LIDTHTHIIASDESAYPFSPSTRASEWFREAPHTAEELIVLMDGAGVEKAVLVQAVGAYGFLNDYAADSARIHPDRFVSACCVDPFAEGAVATLGHWAEDRGMAGVRVFAIAPPGESRLEDPRSFPLWEQARSLGIHVIVTAFTHQLPELRRMLQRFPETPVSLDHCGFPDPGDPTPILEMASEPNLYCKVTSHVLESLGEAAAPFVERLVARYGAERVMWGSDFCQTHDRPYAELVALAERAFGALTPAQRKSCFVDTPKALWPGLR
jgi:predicted TIM-barrel fold metal-dependent hydrolase